MLIGQDVIQKIKESVRDLRETYQKELDATTTEYGGVDVSLPVKIRAEGPKVEVQVGVSFTKSKVRDSVSFVVSGQKELFPENEGYSWSMETGPAAEAALAEGEEAPGEEEEIIEETDYNLVTLEVFAKKKPETVRYSLVTYLKNKTE